MARQTIDLLLREQSNDYSLHEQTYRQATGGELILDPYCSHLYRGERITLSVSVIIPASNACSTLERCLLAIAQSSFHRRYPGKLEIIVVDDGSTDGTWELLQKTRLGVPMKAVYQNHMSVGHARNTGIAIATGDVIICCDADMLLTPFSIEEFVQRHQVLNRVLLIGFRQNVEADDIRVRPDYLRHHFSTLLPSFTSDIRLGASIVGWPGSIREHDHLKQLGYGKKIYLPNDVAADLPNMIWGSLFSLRREDFLSFGGFDERLRGWGSEDALAGAQAIALRNYVIPVYSAVGLHIAHRDRSRDKLREYEENTLRYQEIVHAPIEENYRNWIIEAKKRIMYHYEYEPIASELSGELDTTFLTAFEDELSDPLRRGNYLSALGRYEEAIVAFSERSEDNVVEAQLQLSRVLRSMRHYEHALSVLKDLRDHTVENASLYVELALAFAGNGQFFEAHRSLKRAQILDEADPLLTFIVQKGWEKFFRRSHLYAAQGDYHLALLDCEAALVLTPEQRVVYEERESLLAKL